MDATAAILISIGALIGLYMAYEAIRSRHIPKGMAILHGVAVVSGVVLLLVFALTTEQSQKHWGSLILFAIAAAGGIYVVHKDVTHQRFPLWVMIVHGLIGAAGLLWLIIQLNQP
jgi:hypothetical protein